MFKTILVPVDFSSNSNRALEYAHMLATRFGASLHLIHVCEVPSLSTGSMDAYAIAYTNWSQQLGDEAERELLKVVATLGSVAVTTEVLFGNPARVIVDAATRRHSDLVVMGTVARQGISGALLGNTAEEVLPQLQGSILAIKPDDFASPVS